MDFDHGVNTAINRLREALGDSAESPRFVETIPRRGYRFIAPIELTAAVPEANLAATASPTNNAGAESLPSVPNKQTKIVAVAIAFGIATATIIGLLSLGQYFFARRSGPPIQSVAVLPLMNLSSDADQDYFADGMTDALITDLGKIGSLRVISRTSVMQYKSTKKAKEVRQSDSTYQPSRSPATRCRVALGRSRGIRRWTAPPQGL